jgi:hypothetical protein
MAISDGNLGSHGIH